MLSVFTLSSIDKISDVESDFIDFDPSIKASARYYQNGLLEFNGVAQLMSCKLMNGVWSFDITLVSDTIDYISRLAKIKVNELGWSEYNHALTYDNQQDTWNGTIQLNGSPSSNQDSQGWTGRGYYYGLIDYGFTRPSASTFGVEHIPPQVFCYEVLEKAFNYAGITWDSTFLESQLFKKLLMAYPGGDLPTITQAQADNDSLFTTEDNNTGGYIFNGSFLSYIDTNGPTGFINTFDKQFADNYDCTVTQDNLSQAQTTDPLKFVAASEGLFNLNYAGDHDVDITIVGDGSGAYTINGSYSVRIFLYKNNIPMATDIIYSGAITSATTSLTFSFDYQRQLNLLINDEVTIKIGLFINNTTIQRTNLTSATTTYQIQSNTATLDILKQAQTLSAGGTVYLDSFLPDMTCDQFLKGMITAFNLYVKPSTADASILEIEPLSDFYNASGDAIVCIMLKARATVGTLIASARFACAIP